MNSQLTPAEIAAQEAQGWQMDIDYPYEYWSVLPQNLDVNKAWGRSKHGPKKYSNNFLKACGYKELCPNLGVEKFIIDMELGIWTQKLRDCVNPKQSHFYANKMNFRRSWMKDWQLRYNKVVPAPSAGPFKAKKIAVGGKVQSAFMHRNRMPPDPEEEEKRLNEDIWRELEGRDYMAGRFFHLKAHQRRFNKEKALQKIALNRDEIIRNAIRNNAMESDL